MKKLEKCKKAINKIIKKYREFEKAYSVYVLLITIEPHGITKQEKEELIKLLEEPQEGEK